MCLFERLLDALRQTAPQNRRATDVGARTSGRAIFKDAASRAGESVFVLPYLVPGTVKAGWARLDKLDTAAGQARVMVPTGVP